MDRLIPSRLGMVRVLQLYVLALAVALAVALGVAARVGYAQSPRRDSARVAASDRGPIPRSGRTGQAAAADSATRDSIGRVLRPIRRDSSDLAIELFTRIETKAERTQNERCAANQLYSVGFTCRSAFTPALDVQFGLKTTGGFAERVKLVGCATLVLRALRLRLDTREELDREVRTVPPNRTKSAADGVSRGRVGSRRRTRPAGPRERAAIGGRHTCRIPPRRLGVPRPRFHAKRHCQRKNVKLMDAHHSKAVGYQPVDPLSGAAFFG